MSKEQVQLLEEALAAARQLNDARKLELIRSEYMDRNRR